jgi:putative PIN family toxin of toxin-antitoxin system
VTSVTLDSNIYVSALQFGGIGVRLLGLARAGAIRVDTSEVILAETTGVLRDKFGWDGYRLHFATLELRKFVHIAVPTLTLAVTVDPDDNRIVECAVAAGSDCIVTYDKDLLRLGEYAGIKIVTAVDFLTQGMER